MTDSNTIVLHFREATTILVVAGSKVGERIARDAKSKVIYVPSDMTYEQWRKVISITKIINKSKYMYN